MYPITLKFQHNGDSGLEGFATEISSNNAIKLNMELKLERVIPFEATKPDSDAPSLKKMGCHLEIACRQGQGWASKSKIPLLGSAC